MDGTGLIVRGLLGALVALVWLPMDADAQRPTRSLRAPVTRSAPSQRSIRRSAPPRTSRGSSSRGLFSSPQRGSSSRGLFSSPQRGSSRGGLADLAERLGQGRNNSGRSQTPILDSLLGLRDNNRTDRTGNLRDMFRGLGQDRDRRHDDDKFANAYLTVGLANAAVGLVSVLSERNRYYGGGYGNEPCPACAAEARRAEPVTERVLVEEPRYEQYQVWIPPRYDPYTGRKLGGGFYETRTRFVPAQYAYREVGYGR